MAGYGAGRAQPSPCASFPGSVHGSPLTSLGRGHGAGGLLQGTGCTWGQSPVARLEGSCGWPFCVGRRCFPRPSVACVRQTEAQTPQGPLCPQTRTNLPSLPRCKLHTPPFPLCGSLSIVMVSRRPSAGRGPEEAESELGLGELFFLFSARERKPGADTPGAGHAARWTPGSMSFTIV